MGSNTTKKKKNNINKTKRKKKKGIFSSDQNTLGAIAYVANWASFGPKYSSNGDYGFLPDRMLGGGVERPVFDLHTHSKFSDGFLSPTSLVERAHSNGVNVLALTDHDTMAGIQEAVVAASKFRMRIIPGVEISAVCHPREGEAQEENVHILAYYSSCGPVPCEELERLLESIREGRHLRAKNMLLKLNKLRVPLKWEHVTRIAGNGVAPGRLHVARALVEAGHVEDFKQAFSKYLRDGGPAYASGNEPSAEEVVQLVCRTGGISALAHPWVLKNPELVIRTLKGAGLHAVEVYSGEGKVTGIAELAKTYELLKMGGSDFHGRVGQKESDVGRVTLPIQSLYEFLKIARPIWSNAIKDIVTCLAEDPSQVNLEQIIRFSGHIFLKGDLSPDKSKDIISQCLLSWLSNEEREEIRYEDIMLKLSLLSVASKEEA